MQKIYCTTILYVKESKEVLYSVMFKHPVPHVDIHDVRITKPNTEICVAIQVCETVADSISKLKDYCDGGHWHWGNSDIYLIGSQTKDEWKFEEVYNRYGGDMDENDKLLICKDAVQNFFEKSVA